MRRMLVTLVGACACLIASSPVASAAIVHHPALVRPGLGSLDRDAANPLGVPGPFNGNLLAGARLYVDPNSPAAEAQAILPESDPEWAFLGDIASEPSAHRFYMWTMGSDVEEQVAQYLEQSQVEQPGTTVMLSTYSLVYGACGSTATQAFVPTYDNFIDQVAQGIGDFHVVFFLELDSLITASCLTPAELTIREAELSYAVSVLEADPHVLVYLDGGAADALSPQRQAQLLQASGVADAQGFFLNSTHFDWTTTELAYGEEISTMLGGAHFIINTGENGQGPLKPPDLVEDGNEVLCNPTGRGLGPLSVSQEIAQPTGYPNADGFLWFSNPGGSGGQCDGPQSVQGAPPTGQFWPAYAVMLAQNWADTVTGPQVPWTPQLSTDPSPLSFGRRRRPSSIRRTATVSYVNGVGEVTIQGATVTGPGQGDFTIAGDGCLGRSLNRSQSCHLSIQFAPRHTGRLTATLNIAVEPPGVPMQLALTGTGFKPRRARHHRSTRRT